MKLTRCQLRDLLREALIVEVPEGIMMPGPESTQLAQYNTGFIKTVFVDWDITGVIFIYRLLKTYTKLKVAIAMAIKSDFDPKYVDEATDLALELAVSIAVLAVAVGVFKAGGVAARAVSNRLLAWMGKTAWTGPPPEIGAVRKAVGVQKEYRKVVDKAIEKAERSGNKKIVSELKATRGVIDDSIHLGQKILANPSRLGVATKGVSAPPSLGILSLEPKIIASIEKAANVVAQATPAEAIGIKLSKKMGAARFTTPQRAAIPGKLLTDKAYLEIGDDLTRMIQGGLKKSWPTEIQSTTTVLKGHGKMHGYQFKVGDVITQEQLSGLYTKLLKNDQTMKNIWPAQGDFTSFFGKLIIKAYPSKPAGRGNAFFSAGKNSITLFGKMALPTSPPATKLPETVPNWILRRIESLDFNHEMVHYVDELTGILKAGRAQRRAMTPKIKYSVRVHEINARYQAAISEVRKRIIAGDTQMISLVVDNQGDDFARKFVNIMDAKANGDIYKGVSALPKEMRIEFISHITGSGGAHEIFRNALSKSLYLQGSRLAPSRPIPGGFTIPPEGPYIINPRESIVREVIQQIIAEVTNLNKGLYGSLEKAIADSKFLIEDNTPVANFNKDLYIASDPIPSAVLSPNEIENMTSQELASAIRKELLKNLDLYKPGTKNANRTIKMLQRDAESEYAGSGAVGDTVSYDQIKDRYDNEIFEKIKDVFENVPIRESNNMPEETGAMVMFGKYKVETANPFMVFRESELAVMFKSPEQTAELIRSGIVSSFEKLFAHEAMHLFKVAFVIAAGNDVFVNDERLKDDAGDLEKMQSRDIKSLFSSDGTWGGTAEEQRAELVTYRNWLESQTGEGYTPEIVDALCLRSKLADNSNNKEVFDRILGDIDRKYNILGLEDASNIYQRIIRGAKSGLVFGNTSVNSEPHMDLNLDVVKYLKCNNINDRKIDIMNRIVTADIENDSPIAENRWLKIAGIE